jgi:vancomycin resistance protein VanJ
MSLRLFQILTVLLVLEVICAQTSALWWPGELCTHWSLHCAIFLIPCVVRLRKKIRWGAVAVIGMLFGSWPWILAAYEPRARNQDNGAVKIPIAHANVYYSNPLRQAFLEKIRDSQAQILSLVEVTDSDRERLSQDPRWPHQAWSLDPSWNSGVALLSKLPIAWSINHQIERSPVIEAILRAPETDLCVFVVHLKSPVSPQETAQRNRQLAELAALAAAHAEPTVVLGDLNTTAGNPNWRAFVRQSRLLRPAARMPATWPSWLGPFGITIDHVLARGLGISELDVLNIPSSDHRGFTTHVFVP